MEVRGRARTIAPRPPRGTMYSNPNPSPSPNPDPNPNPNPSQGVTPSTSPPVSHDVASILQVLGVSVVVVVVVVVATILEVEGSVVVVIVVVVGGGS